MHTKDALRKALPAVLVLAALVIGAAYAVYLFPAAGGGSETRLTGSLFVSDAGQSHGGFEYTASYNVSLVVRDGRGTMTATLDTGLGDVLTQHEYSVSDFQKTAGEVRMTLGGRAVVLPWTQQDMIWNHSYDNRYIASWGSTAPAEEMRGSISPEVFSGVPSSYYVELRVA